jgi:hypothetical protein
LRANKCPTFQRVFGEIPCENRTGNSFVEPGILFVEPGNCQVRNREIGALTRLQCLPEREAIVGARCKRKRVSESLITSSAGGGSLRYDEPGPASCCGRVRWQRRERNFRPWIRTFFWSSTGRRRCTPTPAGYYSNCDTYVLAARRRATRSPRSKRLRYG